MIRVDLNSDVGEGIGRDPELMPLISSANIACAAHAGDLVTMRETVRLAVAHGVAVGAHPGYADREHFGRGEIPMTPSALHHLMVEQIERLRAMGPVRHVKPHGALYNLAARDREVADVIAAAIEAVDRSLVLFALSGSQLVQAGRARGLQVAQEVFGDRTYQADGSLTPRSSSSALIEHEAAAVAQVLQMVKTGTVTAVDGSVVKITADTVCLHGDGPFAVPYAQRLQRELLVAGVTVRAFGL